MPGVDLVAASMPDLTDPFPTSTDLFGCTFQFGKTAAFETTSGSELPPQGGVTDAGSVVNIRVVIPAVTNVALTIFYARAASCAQANFSSSVAMTSSEGGPGRTEYNEYIPAFAAGTHVCWKVAADTCGTRLVNPPPGMPAFDYTTQ
jgi:hypothetical protein